MSSRRNPDQTRSALLEAGAQTLIETGISVRLDSLNLIDVCRTAGLSTAGSAYKIWPTQDAFRTDLLDHLLTIAGTDVATIDTLRAFLVSDPDELPSLPELIRTIATDADSWAGGGPGYAVFSILLLASRDDPDLAGRISDADTEVLASFAELYQAVADVYERDWVPPFDATLLATTLSALSEGIAIRSRTLPGVFATPVWRPDPDGDGADRPWSLFACCVEAIIEAYTRPRTCPPTSVPGTPTPPGEADPTTGNPPRAADPPTPRRRRTLAETRVLLLDTGAHMLLDSGLDVTVGPLDPLEVSRRAGMRSSGSLYKIFGTQDAFRAETLRYLASTRLVGDRTPADVIELLHADGDEPPPFSEVVRLAAAANFALNNGTENLVILASGIAAQHDEALAAQFREFELGSLDEFTELYVVVAEHYGRDWTPPFDARLLALALSALVQGFAVRVMATPELVPHDLARPTESEGTDRPWHLFACAVEAIIEAFTHPVDDPGADPDRPTR